MNLHDLGHFVVMADAGQLAIAAARIGVTQPAMTKSLKRLEAAAGSPLFERTSKGLVLTQAGRLLLRRARELLLGMREIRQELADFVAGDSGHLRIGAGPTMTEYLLPQVTEKLLQRSPRATLQIVSALKQALLDRLRNGDLDFVISGLSPSAPPGLAQTVLMQDELVVVASRDHPLARQRTVSLQDLAGQQWILSPPDVLARTWLDSQFVSAGLPLPRASVESDSASTVMAIVASSRLVGFQPRLSVLALRLDRKLAVLNAPDAVWGRTIGITYREGQYMPPVGCHFIELLREAAQGLSKVR